MFNKLKDYIKLIRIKHYIKNLLIFVPLFFSGLYKDINNIWICLVGFLLFSFVSSMIYVFNDICDVEKDRLREVKRNRPIASGRVGILEAYILIGVLAIISLGMVVILFVLHANTWVILLVILYVILNILYSIWLKHVVLVDVVILVSGFLIRLFFGALLINCIVSEYLYLTVMSLAFYMGFGKRRNEIIKSDKNTRKVLQYYNKDFLDKMMYVCLTLTVVFYSMWSVDPNVTSHLHYNVLMWTVPLLMIILFQYSLLVEKDNYGDPVDVLVNNKPLLLTSLLYIIILLIIFV